jgi:16S rRNA (cytosine967-C5)-methyltransferase
MTPAARVAAAIEVLDRILGGLPAERALTAWARGNRYAGSGDRAAVRDHVFSALRCRRSFAALGGGHSGRALMLGELRAAGHDPATIFSGERHAPAALSPAEIAGGAPELVALDCPDWLAPELRRSLGGGFAAVMAALRHRAPVFLRVNPLRGTPAAAIAALTGEGIACTPHPLARNALQVTAGERKISASLAYLEGLVEVQDAASQAVVEALDVPAAGRILDLCAGGGGKALALAARLPRATILAHDANPGRMVDLPARAARAGARIRLADGAGLARAAPFDLVLCDVPCSGSGAWRRSPEAKWALTQARLDELTAMQDAILDRAAPLVAAGGTLAYVTCSLLEVENADRIAAFLARTPGWQVVARRRLTPLDGGDGFYMAHLTRG